MSVSQGTLEQIYIRRSGNMDKSKLFGLRHTWCSQQIMGKREKVIKTKRRADKGDRGPHSAYGYAMCDSTADTE